MHGLQRTHQCPCAPTQIQAAWARFPTPVVPEPPAVLAGSVRLAAQPVAVSASLEASVLRVRLAVLGELPVLGEFAVQLAGSAPTVQVVHLVRAQPVLRVLRVRLAVLERREPSAQVRLEHSEE